jgi:hypothetical protein
MKESKSIEELVASFEANELRRNSVRRSETMRKGQMKGNKTRNKTRDIERAFKERNKE